MNFLLENCDKDYIPVINFCDDFWEDNLREETQAILALIYRDYIVDKEMRKELLTQEEKEYNDKYNVENLFKKEIKKENNQNENNTALVEVKKTAWYKKIYNKLLQIFGKK